MTSSTPLTAIVKFGLRGAEGRVRITYSVNEDPARWGFDLLDLDWGIEVSRGFPVIQAEPSFPGEGYAGMLGWVQVVDYVVVRGGVRTERVWVVPDVPPQWLGANIPYVAFGVNPVFFDAPASPEKNVNWTARTFLTATPDCVMTTVVEPLCGFRWGYVWRGPRRETKAARSDVQCGVGRGASRATRAPTGVELWGRRLESTQLLLTALCGSHAGLASAVR